jgi:hypothetical protein
LAAQFGQHLRVLDVDLEIPVKDLYKLVKLVRVDIPGLRKLYFTIRDQYPADSESHQYWDEVTGDSAVQIADRSWGGPLERLRLEVVKPRVEWDMPAVRHRTPYYAIARNVASLCNNRTMILFDGPDPEAGFNMKRSEFSELVYWLLRSVPPIMTSYVNHVPW